MGGIQMMVLTGVIVWLLLIAIVLRFFNAASEVRRMEDLNKKDKDAK